MKKSIADIIGILSSGLCLIHCLGLPLFLLLGIGISDVHWLEYIFLLLSFISIFKVTAELNSLKWICLFWITFFSFIITLFLRDDYEFLIIPNYIFASLLILAHALNIYRRQSLSGID